MTEPRIRYWQHVDRPGCIEYTRDHWPASEDQMEADPKYREVTVTPVVPGDVIEQAARMLHTLQWDGEQEDAESAWDHYPILAVARQEYLRTAEALADAGLLAGSRTVTPEQREAAEAVLMTSPHMLLLSPGTIAKIVDTVLTAVGLTVEEGGRG